MCQPFDEVIYHDQVCHVEQVWEDAGLSWAILRPVRAINEECGVFIVDQKECQPIER